MAITWILVAHGTAGKILQIGKNVEDIIIKNEFSHPNTAKKNLEINSDRPGRTFQRTSPVRHAMSSNEEPKDHERRIFAKEMANFLAQAHAENLFNNLILVASPNLLGDLRKALPAPVLKTVSHELDKDFMSQNLSPAQLAEKIRDALDIIHY
jgi:protein required for attachment to host cells